MKEAAVIEKIKSHMEKNGLKYKWLCKQIGISTGHFSNIKKGIKKLTPEINEKINKTLGTSFKL
jgi:antitoxin component HigA of HigAB toxin-antitoxin module